MTRPSSSALRQAARELRRVARDTALEARAINWRVTGSLRYEPGYVADPPNWMARRAAEHEALIAVAVWLEEQAKEKI